MLVVGEDGGSHSGISQEGNTSTRNLVALPGSSCYSAGECRSGPEHVPVQGAAVLPWEEMSVGKQESGFPGSSSATFQLCDLWNITEPLRVTFLHLLMMIM